jgi:hypothetical protein
MNKQESVYADPVMQRRDVHQPGEWGVGGEAWPLSGLCSDLYGFLLCHLLPFLTLDPACLQTFFLHTYLVDRSRVCLENERSRKFPPECLRTGLFSR